MRKGKDREVLLLPVRPDPGPRGAREFGLPDPWEAVLSEALSSVFSGGKGEDEGGRVASLSSLLAAEQALKKASSAMKEAAEALGGGEKGGDGLAGAALR